MAASLKKREGKNIALHVCVAKCCISDYYYNSSSQLWGTGTLSYAEFLQFISCDDCKKIIRSQNFTSFKRSINLKRKLQIVGNIFLDI